MFLLVLHPTEDLHQGWEHTIQAGAGRRERDHTFLREQQTTALPHLHLSTLNEGLSLISTDLIKGCCRKKGMVYVLPFIARHMFLLMPALELLRPHNQLAEEVNLAEN